MADIWEDIESIGTDIVEYFSGDDDTGAPRTFADSRAWVRGLMANVVCNKDYSFLEYRDLADQLSNALPRIGFEAALVPDVSEAEFDALRVMGGCAPAASPIPPYVGVYQQPKKQASVWPWVIGIGGIAVAVVAGSALFGKKKGKKKRRRRR